MKVTKSKLRQIIKEELIEEVSTLPRDEAICVGFMIKLSDGINETLPSYEGAMVQDILIDIQLNYLSLEHHELKHLKVKAGKCYNLFRKALKEAGAEGTHIWPEAKEKLANSRYRNARKEYEKYYNSLMSPKKMVDPVKRMGTAPTITQPRVNTKPLYQAPMPSSNPFKVGKLGPDGKYRFE